MRRLRRWERCIALHALHRFRTVVKPVVLQFREQLATLRRWQCNVRDFVDGPKVLAAKLSFKVEQ